MTNITEQQTFMRGLIAKHGYNRHTCSLEWAKAELAGIVGRKSNVNNVSEYDYAHDNLYPDVVRRIEKENGTAPRKVRRAGKRS